VNLYFFKKKYSLFIILSLVIPPFAKDLYNNKEFNIINRRIIEADDCSCGVFVDKKIEKNTDIYQLFYFFIILIN
jgi:hypothetical protein